MQCEFVATERTGVYRCRRCGFVTLPTRFPPTKIHRVCRSFDLTSSETRAADKQLRSSRGLGDTVAKLIERVSGGKLKARRDCGCRKRQAWLNKTFPYRRSLPENFDRRDPAAATPPSSGLPPPASILLRFPHGLGDAVQLTIVLKHLRRFRPHWRIDVAGKPGAHTLYNGLVHRSLVDGRDAWNADYYSLVRTLAWSEPDRCYADSPSTKAERCLREVFSIAPDPALCRYEIHPSDAARRAAREYLAGIVESRESRVQSPPARALALDSRLSTLDSYPVVVFHYQGNSARRRKNVSEDVIRAAVRQVADWGYVPVILDWETPPRSGLVRESSSGPVRKNAWPHVYCPGVDHPLWRAAGCGDGATMAALIQHAALFVGIDSGPAHVAGATDTPSIVVWTGHHPLHYFALADQVTHLVPLDHLQFIRGDVAAGERFFNDHYDFRVYQQLRRALPLLIEEKLRSRHEPDAVAGEQTTVDPAKATPERIVDGDMWVRKRHRQADMVIVRDVLHDDAYAIGQLRIRPRTILDVGAHIGAFAAAAHRRWPRAAIVCVEANRHNLPCLRANVADFADIIHAAATYESRPLSVASTVFDGTDNTGGSYVYPLDINSTAHHESAAGNTIELQRRDSRYRFDGQPIRAITLEEILERNHWQRIDLLKLDCEGCEMSLLENTQSLERIGAIVGEYHDRRWFERIVRRRFAGWHLRILHDAEPGTFWLVRYVE